jgi:hypothetical protein
MWLNLFIMHRACCWAPCEIEHSPFTYQSTVACDRPPSSALAAPALVFTAISKYEAEARAACNLLVDACLAMKEA